MRVKNAAPPTTMTPIAAAATMRASSSAPSRSPSHAKALVCSSMRLPTSETTANAASTPLRASVFQLAGAECSWPKQWQSGARPRARLTADGDAEDREQHEGADRAVVGRLRGQEQAGDRELRERQDERERSGNDSGAPNATTPRLVPSGRRAS